MDDMVERVARELEPQAWAALGTGDTLAYKNRRVSSLRKARAAIAAMREPTEAMLEEGPGSPYLDAYSWGRIIDAALTPPEPQPPSE